jgi:spore coat protein A, manganese oxidase
MSFTRRQILQASAAAGVALAVGARVPTAVAAPPLIKKWVDQLAIPPVVTGGDTNTIVISMVNTTHKFHSGLAASATLAYRCDSGNIAFEGTPNAAGYLGPTIVATTDQPLTVTMKNSITKHPLPIDTTIHGAVAEDRDTPRTATHLHGGNTKPLHDGGPEDVFLDEHTYEYDNTQDAAGIWYHDHAIGITRVNVYAGLAGGYLIRDTAETGIDTGLDSSPLPTGKYEIPLILQDKLLAANGQQVYDNGVWMPEFFGDVSVVNGIAFPFLSVDKGVYRFRAYNGSQARFYRVGLKVKSTGAALGFFQIGSDGGLLNAPVPLTQLVLGPGERADLLVDFRGLKTGELVEMGNNAPTPFPNGPKNLHKGGAPLPQLMQFRVTAASGPPAPPIAGMSLRPINPITRLNAAAALPGVRTRTHSLVEIMGPAGPVMALLNNRTFHHPDYATDPVKAGSLEVWEFVNTTVDSHPIHLHLVQFQVLNRQAVNTVAYLAAAGYDMNPTDGMLMENEVNTGDYPAPSATPFFMGPAQPPPANELGWKDTVIAPPGMVTRIIVPFGKAAVPTNISIAAREVYVPDPAQGENDYVWHCHILEHEEKDMMQYYRIIA